MKRLANTNLTFPAGTAVGYFFNSGGGTYGLSLGDSVTMTLNGTVTSPCHLVKYSTSQEGGNGNWKSESWLGGITGQYYTYAAPTLQLNYAICSQFPAEGNVARDNSALLVVNANNCEFWNGCAAGYYCSLNFTNCLFVNIAPGLWYNYSAANLFLRNCSVKRGYLFADNTSGGNWPVTILNCAFDQTTFYMNAHGGTTNGYYTDYNSFLQNSNTTVMIGAHDITNVVSYNWQTSWLGTYYQPTNSPLIDHGSTNANLLGLYHFTTQTNQSKETNSIVDIGYHYVATDVYGHPLDSNGDGMPDYIADANGNGVNDPGEIPWNLPETNLVLWLRADAGTTTNSSGNVSNWADQSGQGNNAQQTSTSLQPLWVAGGLNALPIIRFNGSNSFLNLPNFLTGLPQAEVFAVVKVSPSVYLSGLWAIGGGGNASDSRYTWGGGDIQEDFGSTSTYDLGVPPEPTTQYHVYEVSAQTNNWLAWINGVLLYQTTNNSVNFDGDGPATLGADAFYFLGDMAEVLIFNRALTAGERTVVNGYLNGKYGLVAAVPPTPTNLVANAISQTQIGLTWNEALTNGGATQISIERSTTSNGTFSVVAQIPNALSFIDTNLMAGTNYYYRVRAINLSTWSSYSNETNATTLTAGTNLPLGNLALWLKADSGLAQGATNTPVDLWADQSGNGNNAQQVIASKQPLYVPNALNGLPVVRFNGSNSFLNLPNFLTGLPQAEVFAVVKVSPSVYLSGLWAIGGGGNASDSRYTWGGGDIQEDFGSTGTYDLGVPTEPTTQYHIYEVSAQTNNWAAWINGVLLYQTSNNSVNFDGDGPATLGADAFYFLGDMAEVVIFNRALSSAERTAVNRYLNGKYGLVAAVPPAPTNLVANVISQTQIGLTWNEALTNDGATQISIERKSGSAGTYAVVGQIANALSFIDTNLMAGTNYYYRVRAINLSAWSPYSNETNATTLTTGTNLPLSNLALWLKADSGLAQGTTNTPVDLWADQSGNGNNAQQNIASKQPLYIPNAINGLPSVRFDGTNSFLQLPNFLKNLTQSEVFAVVKATVTNSYQSLWLLGNSGNAYDQEYPLYNGTIHENFGSTSCYIFGVPAQPLNQYHMYEVSAQTTDWAAWINGTLLFNYSAVNTGGYVIGFNDVSFNTTPTLSGQFNGGPNTFFTGDIVEVMIFNRSLTTDERNTVGNYLFSKYALAQSAINTSLPGTPGGFVSSGIAPYELNLQWSCIATNTYNFIVERKLGVGGTFQEIGSVPSYLTNFVDTTASPNNTYYYRVKAHNLFGDSSYSTIISPPSVSLTNWPATIIENATNSLMAQAADALGSVANVIFYAYNGYIATATGPYIANWLAPMEGAQQLAVLATDSLGNSQYSAPVAVTVYRDSNGDGIPDVLQVSQGNSPVSPWVPPALNTNDHTAPIITLLIPTNAVVVP